MVETMLWNKRLSRIVAISLSFAMIVANLTMFRLSKAEAAGANEGTEQISASEEYIDFYSGTPVTFDSMVGVTATDPSEVVDGATIVVDGWKSGDSAQFAPLPGGITPSNKNGVFVLSGTAPVASYQTALQGFQFTPSTKDQRTVTFSLGTALPFSDNGHFYEFVTSPTSIKWPEARNAAEGRSYYGRQGYLATITSAKENGFIAEKASSKGWIGGLDILRDPDLDGAGLAPANAAGDWRWVTGPEGLEDGGNGLKFYDGYNGNVPTPQPGVVDNEYGDPENDYIMYTNWDSAGSMLEPNNDAGYEYLLHIYEHGRWNDFPYGVASVNAYLVEYGGMPGDNPSAISHTFTLVDKTDLKNDVQAANGLEETDYTPGTWGPLQFALTVAQAVVNDPHALPEDIEAASQALADAQAGLLKKPPVAVEASHPDNAPQVMIDFDKPVKFDGAGNAVDGFHITLDGITEAGIVAAEVSANNNQRVILTLASDVSFSNDPVVRVEYDAGQGHLTGKAADVGRVDDFAFIAKGPFGAALQILNPTQSTFYGGDFPLTISGEAALFSTVSANVYNAANEPVFPALVVETTVSGSVYAWSSNMAAPLAPGVYEIRVTSEKWFGDKVESSTKIKSFTIPQLQLIQVAVEDETPNQAVLTFNQNVESVLNAGDFAALKVDGRNVVAVNSIQGDKVTVTLNSTLGPKGALVVEYNPDAGNIYASSNPLNELLPIEADNQAGIAKNNGIIPLKVVSAYPEDGKLKIVFNKPVHEGANLSGLTYGGVPLQEPYEIVGNILTAALPAEPVGHTLGYDPVQGNIVENDNPNNPLSGLQPGIDLGEDQTYIDDNGQLPSNGIGLANGATAVPLAPEFKPDVSAGYKAVVPNAVDSVGLNPAPVGNAGTLVKVSLNGEEVTSGSWGNLPLREGLNTIIVDIVDASNPAIHLGQYKFEVIRATGKLVSLESSSGSLNPAFNAETKDYEIFVSNDVTETRFNAVTLDPGAALAVRAENREPVNVSSGLWSQWFDLMEGENRFAIAVTDSTGNVTNYTVTIYRAEEEVYTGGSGIPSGPTSGGTKVIEVDVVIGGDNAADITRIPINRTTHGDGTITDQVTFTKAKAEETVEKAIKTGEKVARVVIPDSDDIVGEVNVNIPVETARLLKENGIDLEIYTENAIVRLPNASLEGIDENFYFRLVPVKDDQERNEIEDRATVEKVVREVAGNNEIEVVARPMTIETNLSSRPVTLILPLKGVRLPVNAVEREAFLAQLGIFIEHSDGGKEVVHGEPVTYSDGLLGLEFSVTKFSTFTIISFNNQESGSHSLYIVGFPDGEFKPDEAVTRAQMATMIARNLGYDEQASIDLVPFEDVALEHYAAGAIAFVKSKGIMNGDPDGLFRADEAITRAEMATVVSNYLDLPVVENGQTRFADSNGHWAQAIIEANLAAGIVAGYPDGSFRPDSNLTRAEAVTMINKMFKRGPLYGISSSIFPDVAEGHWAFAHIQEAARDHSYLIGADGKEQFVK